MDVLRPLLDAHGHDVPIAATLHCVTQARARSTLDVVEVRIDGRRVGILSPTQSGNSVSLFAISRSRVPRRSPGRCCGAIRLRRR
jgi:hypothetical protein